MDAGLLAGLAQGLNQGLGAYQTTSRQQQQLQADKEERAARRRLAQMQMQQAGFEEGPEGMLVKTADQERRDALGEAEKQAGLLKTGYKAEYDPLTKRAELAKLEGFRDLEQENRKLQNQKLRQELAQTDVESPAMRRLQKSPSELRGKIGFVASAMKNLADYDQAVGAGQKQEYVTSQTPLIGRFMKSTPIDESRTNLEEAIGRMASGGAINKDEEARFRQMIPTAADFGDSAVVQRKLAKLRSEMDLKLTAYGFSPEELPQMGFNPQQLGLLPKKTKVSTDPKRPGLIPETMANSGANNVTGEGQVTLRKGGEVLTIPASKAASIKGALADGFQMVDPEGNPL